ncbi:MAG: maltose alpha-D-glucosyltransferase [Candidatus Omnitrophica bacterium]|nr:maltose alpha-D-glucosyltransferase [Candidatus Omnitrophota bacterium]
MAESVMIKDPQWYKDAIIYELHVRAFYDSNNDGIGDFQGLIQKLDYFEGLGITALWLLPFYPSPLKDDGYDIADYYKIHADYGTLKDFKEFVKEAHKRGIRVITELVLNHTSREHQWFKRAQIAKPGSKDRNYYVWSDTPEKYQDARIIFTDFETSNWTWDSVAKAYYWHRFYSHQPDLNFDNPAVHKSLLDILDFWFDMGVDGLRLDAIPYLYEREGTNCENLAETHAFLKKLRKHVDKNHQNKMLLAEANQWPEDACEYFGNGDECHMSFHFPLMPRMFMSIQMEDSFPILDILNSTPNIPENCQWAIFLRNHDELTLEMVTDEERDYMYRSYASDPRAKINVGIRRRLAPLLGNNRRKIELINSLLLSLPGTPVLYYGDEIGMGDNYYLGDRNGVRTPMQWSPDRNAGFSRSNPQQLYFPVIIDPDYHYESINVESQNRNLSSLLWWMKRILSLRKRHKAFSRGSNRFVGSNNMKVLSYIREYEDEAVLVVANLSRFVQSVTLALPEYAGSIPEELFSQNAFTPINKKPYVLTLGPHDFYWLLLKKEKAPNDNENKNKILELVVQKKWNSLVTDENVRKLFEQNILLAYLLKCRWFSGKARSIRNITIKEYIPLVKEHSIAYLLFVLVRYYEGASETYLLPVSFGKDENIQNIITEYPQAIIAHITAEGETGILYDSVYDSAFRAALFNMVQSTKKIKSDNSLLKGTIAKGNKGLLSNIGSAEESYVLKGEQSNTNIIFGQKIVLKLYRKIEEGINPDLEISRYLSDRNVFKQVSPYYGAIEYEGKSNSLASIALMQGFVNNVGDGWNYAVDAARKYYEQILARRDSLEKISLDQGISQEAIGQIVRDCSGEVFIEMMELLGQRTAELHINLSNDVKDREFSPELFSLLYQRSIYQSVQTQTRKTMQFLAQGIKKLPNELKAEAKEVLAQEKIILEAVKPIIKKKILTRKMRIHGDYHLGQVLFTGNDFVIIDFEGEPMRPLSERRLKYSPFRDVAGMMRSMHYAAHAGLHLKSSFRLRDVSFLKKWAEPWYEYASAAFLKSYSANVKGRGIVPKSNDDLELLLHVFLLEKAMYEISYELNNRPEWIAIPLKGIQQLLRQSGIK